MKYQKTTISIATILLTACGVTLEPKVLSSSDQYITIESITLDGEKNTAEIAEAHCEKFGASFKYIPTDNPIEYTYECIY